MDAPVLSQCSAGPSSPCANGRNRLSGMGMRTRAPPSTDTTVRHAVWFMVDCAPGYLMLAALQLVQSQHPTGLSVTKVAVPVRATARGCRANDMADVSC